MKRRSAVVWLGVVTVLLAMPCPSWALLAGDILVVDKDADALVSVDPLTGNRSEFSGGLVGLGTTFSEPRAISIDAMGYILVSDSIRKAVFEVDHLTGNRVILSGDPLGTNVGSGVGFNDPRGLARYGGSVYVVDRSKRAVFKVDPATGDRTIISGDPFGANVGSGPNLRDGEELIVTATGKIIVTDSDEEAVYVIDPVTGDRSILSDSLNGLGPDLRHPFGLVMDASGKLIVSDRDDESLFLIDALTGDRSILSDALTGLGPGFNEPRGIALDLLGQILVADQREDALYKVDPLTGDRSILSDSLNGTGTSFSRPVGVAVFQQEEQKEPPIPEPVTTTLAGLGLCALALQTTRRRRA